VTQVILVTQVIFDEAGYFSDKGYFSDAGYLIIVADSVGGTSMGVEQRFELEPVLQQASASPPGSW
jgi:hypothetical protein